MDFLTNFIDFIAIVFVGIGGYVFFLFSVGFTRKFCNERLNFSEKASMVVSIMTGTILLALATAAIQTWWIK